MNNERGACRADDDYMTVRTTRAEVVSSDESCSDRLFEITLKSVTRRSVGVYLSMLWKKEKGKKRKEEAPPLVVR